MVKESGLLTVAQAAKRLGVSPNTVRAWADRGAIPVVRLPSGHRRFDARALDATRQQMDRRDAADPTYAAWLADGERWRREHQHKLTDAERTRGLAAVEAMARLANEIAARNGYRTDIDSVELIRQMREEHPLTEDEVRRGLAAVAEMERLAKAFQKKYGPTTVESWQLLDEARNERERQLTGEA